MLQSRAAQGPGNLGIGKAPQLFKELNLDKNNTSYYKMYRMMLEIWGLSHQLYSLPHQFMYSIS